VVEGFEVGRVLRVTRRARADVRLDGVLGRAQVRVCGQDSLEPLHEGDALVGPGQGKRRTALERPGGGVSFVQPPGVTVSENAVIAGLLLESACGDVAR